MITKEIYDAAALSMRPQLIRAATAIGLSEEDARDVAQDAVAYCYAKLDEYDPEQASLGTWVTRIVTMLACRFIRDEKARRPGTEPGGFDPLIEDTGESRRAQRRTIQDPEPYDEPRHDMKLDVRAALASLDTATRKAVFATVVAGYTSQEYARKAGLSRQRVDQLRAIGLAKMRAYLEGYGGDALKEAV